MRNSIFKILLILLLNSSAIAETVQIEAKKITLDKNKEVSIFENDVKITTEDNTIITSDFLKYDKKIGLLQLEKNVTAKDKQNNIIKTNKAEYDEINQVFKSYGNTSIETNEKYLIEGSDIIFDKKKGSIISKNKTKIIDVDSNQIYLENFEYNNSNNIFKSIGLVLVNDNKGNSFEFSQIYIDSKKKEILGTDAKSFLNQEDFKLDKRNKPRIFSNSIELKKDKRTFNKSIFTLCDYRKKDKCPPWSIQSSKMLHDNKKKTIYYNNAVVKVYDIPIFYLPKLSHPDPSVDRRSGFLNPSLTDTKNLGTGVSIPYFFNLGLDKNFTFTNRVYFNENPIFLGEYQQALKNSFFYADFGYTEGYKKTSTTKRAGEKSHFFAKFLKDFKGKNNSDNSVSISVQDVSNDKYLKLYRIKSNLVDYSKDSLESTFAFTRENDDMFFGFNASVYETLKEGYNDKYEFILPEITFDKNLVSSNLLGNIDLQSNIKIHNFDTNKFTKFAVNDFNWNFRDLNFDSGLKSKLFGKIKNINYEVKNVDIYKTSTTSEFFSAVGILSELNFQKINDISSHFFKPKFLIRYAPGSMRQETTGSRLNPSSAFSLDRLDNINNFETGLSGTIGMDYKINKNNREFDFSLAQVISEKENKKMSSVTSLDEKLSDLVGSSTLTFNEKFKVNYNFSLDQNYNDFNYNEIGSTLNLEPLKIDFDYLQEKKHIGNQEYFNTKVEYTKNNVGIFSLATKRDLIKNSAEYYDLSYEYANDCLRAGIVYRREFYNDSEIEPENSLMFKITLTPFGDINTPAFNQ